MIQSIFEPVVEELTGEEIFQRAVRAEAILSDTVFTQALREAEIDTLHRWIDTEPGDTAGREDCWSAMRAIESVRKALRSYVTDAEVARERLAT